MERILELLMEGEYLTTEQIGQVLGLDEKEVKAKLDDLRKQEILLGWRPVLNPDKVSDESVRAVIEVKISPEREGGFDRIAGRISRFDRVESCYLMSGGYDLMVVVRTDNLRKVAQFVFEKLATIEGVTSTATRFMLRAYKEQGYLLESPTRPEDKPAVSP